MTKKLIAIVCVILLIITATGCLSANNSSKDTGVPPVSIADPTFSSFEELNAYLLSAIEYSRNGRPPEASEREEAEMRWAVDAYNVDEMEYYYMPSWIPEGFHINRITIYPYHFAYSYFPDDYDYSQVTADNELDNKITFTWERGDYTLEYTIGSRGLAPVEGIEGLYFYEYGPPNYPARRGYFWLEDGQIVRYSLPLRLITGTHGPNGSLLSEEIDRIMGNGAQKVILDNIAPKPLPVEDVIDDDTDTVDDIDIINDESDVDLDNTDE